MKAGVLYFPFIRVPESDWLTRMLLYWDSVRTITPYEFLQDPERLGPHTQRLVQEGLVEPIFPGEYVYELEGFEEEFIGLLQALGPELEIRRKRFNEGQNAPIHLEKLGELAGSLEGLRLAREEGDWSLVERETAEEFMSYLACALGQLPDVQAIPVTDGDAGIVRLAGRGGAAAIGARLASLRLAILEDVFPAPAMPLEAVEIAEFKERHGDLLTQFRLEVEKEVIRLADFQDEELRRAAEQNLSDRIQRDVHEIQSKLEEFGIAGISMARWLAVLENVPVVGRPVSILTSLTDLFKREEKPVIGPFAYAGYAAARLLNHQE